MPLFVVWSSGAVAAKLIERAWKLDSGDLILALSTGVQVTVPAEDVASVFSQLTEAFESPPVA